MNNNFKFFLFFLLYCVLTNCSFNQNSEFWVGSDEDRKRIEEIEAWQLSENDQIYRIYSSEKYYNKEKSLSKKIILTNPKKNLSWQTHGFNNQNYIGHAYLDNINNNFLNKKFGKNKFDISNLTSSPLIHNNSIIFTDDTGSIFNVNLNGRLNWKKNIYKKISKTIYKNLSFSIDEEIIYISDNIGFIYAINLDNGSLIWIKNHGIPLKSRIKIFNKKIFLVDQDNRILCFDIKNGSKVWDIRTAQSFIKSQYFLALAVSENGYLITINSRGDLFKIDEKYGKVYWSLNVASTKLAQDIDFFESSDIVIIDDEIIFSTSSSTYSLNLQNGYVNWRKDLGSNNIPIIDGSNIFLVTNNGFLVNLDRDTGEVIYSSNILKILDRKKRKTQVIGYVLGSGKIYSLTANGYIVISSASLGNTLNFKKIGSFRKNKTNTSPIISNGSLFILTKNQKILGFN